MAQSGQDALQSEVELLGRLLLRRTGGSEEPCLHHGGHAVESAFGTYAGIPLGVLAGAAIARARARADRRRVAG